MWVRVNCGRIAETGTPADHKYLTDLIKGLHGRQQQGKIILDTDLKISQAQVKAQSELEAAAAVANSTDAYTAEEEVEQFGEHGLDGFNIENADAELDGDTV